MSKKINTTETTKTEATVLTAGQKAARTKGPFWQKVAGIKAQITKLQNVAEELRGKDRAAVTRMINEKIVEMNKLGLVEDLEQAA